MRARAALLDQARRLFVFPHLFSNRFGFTGTEFNSCCLASGAERELGCEVSLSKVWDGAARPVVGGGRRGNADNSAGGYV